MFDQVNFLENLQKNGELEKLYSNLVSGCAILRYIRVCQSAIIIINLIMIIMYFPTILVSFYSTFGSPEILWATWISKIDSLSYQFERLPTNYKCCRQPSKFNISSFDISLNLCHWMIVLITVISCLLHWYSLLSRTGFCAIIMCTLVLEQYYLTIYNMQSQIHNCARLRNVTCSLE